MGGKRLPCIDEVLYPGEMIPAVPEAPSLGRHPQALSSIFCLKGHLGGLAGELAQCRCVWLC